MSELEEKFGSVVDAHAHEPSRGVCGGCPN